MMPLILKLCAELIHDLKPVATLEAVKNEQTDHHCLNKGYLLRTGDEQRTWGSTIFDITKKIKIYSAADMTKL